jgi:FtsP/CotA-like multicopper oxidase with cupredoxin domain
MKSQDRTGLSRRTFVKGLALGGAATSLGFAPASIWAQQNSLREPTSTLSGTNFELKIDETSVNFTGALRKAITVNHSLPAPTLRWKQGDTVTLRVSNMTGEDAFHTLARYSAAGKHGWCAGAEFSRHLSWR